MDAYNVKFTCQIIPLSYSVYPINCVHGFVLMWYNITGLILGLCPANERWRYFVTTSLIGWMQA